MKKRLALTVALVLLAAIGHAAAYAQTGNGQLGGIVQDPSNALIPGVSITLTNTGTGITATQISNESGSYNFASVQPGVYTVTASLPGFKTFTATNVQVGTSAQVRVNVNLEVGSVDSKVEVSISQEALLTESSASVGDVLPAQRALDLPVVGNDIIDLVRILPGYRQSQFSAAGTAMYDTFAGQTLDTVNVTRDGLSVNSGRYDPRTYGLSTTTNINPELVGEIRLILAPVDAELGRGTSQIQIQTRSGTNKYTGSAVWRIQNSALNANTWDNNNNLDANGAWSPTKPNWRNANNITVTYGGPILRNKTFFFASWDQQISNSRSLQTNTVYTDSARQGIFRYWEFWNPQNSNPANEPISYPVTATTASRRAVDAGGNPLRPSNNPDGSPYTGRLMCFSIFGNVKVDGSPFGQADCAGGTAIVGAGPWDPLRTAPDSTRYIAKILEAMPRANYFQSGDGLNTAAFRWERGSKGQGGGNAAVGVADFVNRKQINLKIDHNFNANHKVSGNWSYQIDNSADFVPAWPGGINGETKRTPQVLTLTGTSTLSASMLNEVRVGFRRDKTDQLIPLEHNSKEIRDLAAEWYLTGGANPENGKTYPVAFNPAGIGNGLISIASQSLGNVTPLYNFADTFSWTHGRHSMRFGGELRLTRSNGYNSVGGNVIPVVNGGAPGGFASILASTTSTDPIFTQLTGLLAAAPAGGTTARSTAANLLYFHSASIASASMLRWINDADDVANGHWEDMTTIGKKYRDQIANEWSAFWKDDWKVTKDFTLNVGLRYDYYGAPYIGSGFTTAPINLGSGLFGQTVGATGDFDNWLRPGSTYLTGYGSNATAANALRCASGQQQSAFLPVSTCDPNKLTQVEFVGPNTPNPDKTAVPVDKNNFSPAVGFSWQLPWFGAGKTTLRGGYQLTYNGAGRDGLSLDSILGSAPGAINSAGLNFNDLLGPDSAPLINTRAPNLTDIANIVPIRATAAPGQTLPIYGRSVALEAYDRNFRTPYTQNLTMQVTRSLTRQLTLDLRYVGTLGRKLEGEQNLNASAVFDNPELFQALEVTRNGGDSALFDQMFAGLNLSGVTTSGTTTYGAIGTCVTQPNGSTAPGLGREGCGANQVMQHGSAHLRRNTATYATNLANGNYVGVIDSLRNSSAGTGYQALPAGLTGVSARALRNGCDRIANGLYNPNSAASPTNIATRCFPEDYFIATPQFSTATFHGNFSHNNYHSLQAQYSLRAWAGVSFQGTYTWQKLLTDRYNTYVDPRNRQGDYSLDYSSIFHEYRMNGTFELPIGPNKFLFGNSSGVLGRVLERWQFSMIYNVGSGAPRDTFTGQKLYAGGGGNQPQARPNIVGPWENPKTDYKWNGPNNVTGTIYGFPNPYVAYDDPQCAQRVGDTDSMGFNLRGSCTLNGLAKVVPAGTAGAILMDDGTTWGIPVLENPLPGTQGNQGARMLRLPGRWTLDGNLSKTFRVNEAVSAQMRFDATNILNHPNPGEPTYNIQDSNFGRVTGRQGAPRSFQGQLRLTF